jgi:hypothetical protein
MLVQHSQPPHEDGMRSCLKSAGVTAILPDWQSGKSAVFVGSRFYLPERNLLPFNRLRETDLRWVVELIVGHVEECRGPPNDCLDDCRLLTALS